MFIFLMLPGSNSDTAKSRKIANGVFKPTWESLENNYHCPEWFRDAKFGIWAHWTAQCVPEQGDWYARMMYIQGTPQYEYHLKTYGHPSKFGFMEIDHLWKAEHWDPEHLMQLYKRAGAKYIVATANHHDNFDCYDSKFHAWNSVNVGPKKESSGSGQKSLVRTDCILASATTRRMRGIGFKPPTGMTAKGRRPESATMLQP